MTNSGVLNILNTFINLLVEICPSVDFKDSKINMLAVLSLIKNKLVKSVHDCSKGGFAIAVSELSIFGNIGCDIDINKMPSVKNLSSEKKNYSQKVILVICW